MLDLKTNYDADKLPAQTNELGPKVLRLRLWMKCYAVHQHIYYHYYGVRMVALEGQHKGKLMKAFSKEIPFSISCERISGILKAEA